MNSLHIIGNIVRDPELRSTPSGSTVCSITVAVNRRKANPDGTHDADFFKVSAWNKLGEICSKYLSKGRKVSVVGSVSVSVYKGKDGKPYANMEVTASDVEFISSRTEGAEEEPHYDQQSGMTAVNPEDLPF